MKSNPKRLLAYVLRQKNMILWGVLATLLMGLVDLFIGSLWKFLVDSLGQFDKILQKGMGDILLPVKYSLKSPFHNEKIVLFKKTLQGTEEVFQALIWLCLLFLGFYVLYALSNYGRRFFMHAATQRVLQRFKEDIYRKVLKLPAVFFRRNKTGDLVSRITYDVTTLSEIMDLLVELARMGIYILIFIPVMFFQSWQLSILTILFFPIATILMAYVTKHIRVVSKRLTDNVGNYTGFLEEKINRFKLIKSFGTEKEEDDAFSELIEHNYQHNLKLIKLKYLLNPSTDLLSRLVLGAVFILYSYKLTHGAASAGDIVFFLYIVQVCFKPIKKVAQAWGQLHIALISTGKIFNLIDSLEENIISSNNNEQVDSIELLKFTDLTFSFPDSTSKVLTGINLEVLKGDRIAIHGRTGVGKSTLMNLIPNFYQPNSGKIEINGINYTDISLAELRSKIKCLDADTLFMNGTIRENIEYGGGVIPKEKEKEFLKFIGLDKSSGFDTLIGKDGADLSEGQKQKMAFLRVLLSKPKVLIFDEAFGPLDADDIDYFMQLCKDVDIMFLVSRKDQVLKYATKTYVLEDGELVSCS